MTPYGICHILYLTTMARHDAGLDPTEITMTTTTDIRITYGDDVCTMTWSEAQASTPILLDGVSTGYQTADAHHRVGEAARLVAGKRWGTVYDTQEDADEADATADPSTYCVWDEVVYEEESATLARGLACLGEYVSYDGGYAYYAPETGRWYEVFATDVLDLGDRLRADEDGNAYSSWCSDCGEELDVDPRSLGNDR